MTKNSCKKDLSYMYSNNYKIYIKIGQHEKSELQCKKNTG